VFVVDGRAGWGAVGSANAQRNRVGMSVTAGLYGVVSTLLQLLIIHPRVQYRVHKLPCNRRAEKVFGGFIRLLKICSDLAREHEKPSPHEPVNVGMSFPPSVESPFPPSVELPGSTNVSAVAQLLNDIKDGRTTKAKLTTRTEHLTIDPHQHEDTTHSPAYGQCQWHLARSNKSA